MGKQVYLSDNDIKNIQIVFDYYFNSGNWINSDEDKEEYNKRNKSFENTSNKIDKAAKKIVRHTKITGVIKMSYIDGICKWKNCKVNEIQEDEMENCSWNNDCENCGMNTQSSSYDSNND